MSVLKFIAAQFGLSGTASNNLTMTAEAANGTFKLARGNQGATTADILTVDTNNIVRLPQTYVTCFARRTSAVALTGNAFTQIVFDVTDINSKSFYNTSNGRFTPTIAGWYQINSAVHFTSGTVPDRVIVSIYKNGTETVRGSDHDGGPDGFANGGIVSQLMFFNGTTDYADIRVFVNASGGSYGGNVLTNFGAFLVHPL